MIGLSSPGHKDIEALSPQFFGKRHALFLFAMDQRNLLDFQIRLFQQSQHFVLVCMGAESADFLHPCPQRIGFIHETEQRRVSFPSFAPEPVGITGDIDHPVLPEFDVLLAVPPDVVEDAGPEDVIFRNGISTRPGLVGI